MANDLYSNVTARILQSLEAGVAPWVKPWSATPGRNVPLNVISGKAYQGVNAILLWGNAGRFATPHYLTYKQALDLGGHVRKGETGFQICKVLQLVSKPKDGSTDQDGRAFSTMKFFTVFNVDQCEGLPARVLETPEYKPNHSDDRDATIDELNPDAVATALMVVAALMVMGDVYFLVVPETDVLGCEPSTV